MALRQWLLDCPNFGPREGGRDSHKDNEINKQMMFHSPANFHAVIHRWWIVNCWSTLTIAGLSQPFAFIKTHMLLSHYHFPNWIFCIPACNVHSWFPSSFTFKSSYILQPLQEFKEHGLFPFHYHLIIFPQIYAKSLPSNSARSHASKEQQQLPVNV